MQQGFYFNQSRCSGCFTCVVACKDWHDIPAGPVFWRRVTTTEQGRFPHVSVTFFSSSCYHCSEPPCVPACPVGAITKREEDGIVVVDHKLCQGKDSCDLCLQACPYGAPQFGVEDNAKMEKCDLCLDRWLEGKKPICVEACLMRALDAGTMEELEAKYGRTREVIGFTYNETSKPSIVFKAKE